MVNILVIAVSLVTLFLTENAYCTSSTKNAWSKQRYVVPDGATFRFRYNNPMQRSNPVKKHANDSWISPEKAVTPKSHFKSDWNNETNVKSPNTSLLEHERKSLLGKVIQKSFMSPEAERGSHDNVPGSKRAVPAVAGALTKLAGNEQVQQAAVEKGIEVAGKLVDKQLEIIDQAQEKASDFLKKEIKLDITPDKGWETDDMFLPPGYHINAEIEGEKEPSSPEQPQEAYNYPAGMGSVMMNGCWGTGYQKGDPCFDALEATGQCRNMIDGAAFIGVGFDGRGEYSPESRKMSIIQRNCGGGSSYDGFQVPDTMNVHGIYDTNAHMTVFTSRAEYQRYLQGEAGVSGSFLGFYAGVKKAWGGSQSGAKQTNLAIFDIDVDRYEIFKDEVKPQDLSRSFLREFVNLPNTYFAPGAPAKFQDFILRWGTHYIKSARFGGQLELRKTQLASRTASKEEFAEESEVEFKSLFWSAGSRSSFRSGSSSQSQRNYMSTSINVQGGSQRVAAVITDMYSPTFKSEFTEWLQSIPTYPKAFKFLMGYITDLVDFRANDLFPEEEIDWGCEKHGKNLTHEEESERRYYIQDGKRIYCEFSSRTEMDVLLKRKRVSLKRAIEVYMEEGPMSISDVSLPAGKAGCETNDPKYKAATKRPSWTEITTESKRFVVIFDMKKDLIGDPDDGFDIPKSMSRTAQHREGKWYTADENGEFHLYDGFRNGGSGTVGNNKISIFGLVLTYNEADGSLVLSNAEYEESKKYFPALSELLKGKQLARVAWPTSEVFKKSVSNKNKNPIGHLPCNVRWSNGLRFDPSDTGGKCLHFTASTKGSLYVVLSAVPRNRDTWYHVEISSYGIGIYKSQGLKVSTVKTNAASLGDDLLYQSYFVCVTETTTSTVIEYGKSLGSTDSGDVYLSMIDHDQPIHARFYSFGNGEEPAQIVDSHVISRKLTVAECKGDTYQDKEEPNCVQKCHEACAPLAGCRANSQGEPRASECNECRYARTRGGDCVNQCPTGEVPNNDKYCTASYDLSFKRATTGEDSKIVGFPTLNQFSICFWIQFTNIEPGIHNKILEYHNTGSDYEVFHIKVYNENRGMVLYFNVKKTSTSTVLLTVTFDKDDKWRHYCVVRDSNSGETKVFADGVDPHAGPTGTFILPRKVPLAGGKMYFGGFGTNQNFRGVISDLNIWDRMLSDDEIAKMAQSCDGGNLGNVKNWSNLKNELTLSKYTLITPSKCKKSGQ